MSDVLDWALVTGFVLVCVWIGGVIMVVQWVLDHGGLIVGAVATLVFLFGGGYTAYLVSQVYRHNH